MYLVYGMYGDRSGFTHKTYHSLTHLIKFLVDTSYDYYTIWQVEQQVNGDELVEIYSNVPKEMRLS
jgi:hypothetical protein